MGPFLPDETYWSLITIPLGETSEKKLDNKSHGSH
jgi:hypothetical protein